MRYRCGDQVCAMTDDATRETDRRGGASVSQFCFAGEGSEDAQRVHQRHGGGDARRDHAARPRLLGVQDAAQRRRARPVHRAGRAARRASRLAPSAWVCTRAPPATSSTPWSRWACSSGRTGATRNTPRRRPLPRPGQADVRRRHAGDGQHAALPASGAASPRPCAPGSRRTRPSTAATSSARSTPTRPGWSGFLKAMTGISAPGAAGDRAAVPVGSLPDLRSTSAPPRAACRSGGAGPPAPDRRRLRPAGGRARLRRATSRATASPTACASIPGDFFARLPAHGGRAGHGPHPARLGPRPEARDPCQGLRGPAAGRGADRLRGDDRRRPARRTPSAC